jgi:hypothetical protein
MILRSQNRNFRRYLTLIPAFAAFMTYSMTSLSEDIKPIKILPGAAVGKLGIKIEGLEVSKKSIWRALVCVQSSCELRSVKFNFEKDVQKPEILHISLIRNRSGKLGEMTVAVFSGLPNSDNPVKTYFTTRSPRTALDSVSGTIGIAFDMPNSGLCKILPRWNHEAADKAMTVYVEQGQQRQAIGKIPIEALSRRFKTRDILIWAGDLDGDGKLDLITRNTPDAYGVNSSGSDAVISNGLNLWLSSIATSGSMMGLAASLDNWEDIVEEESGC